MREDVVKVRVILLLVVGTRVGGGCIGLGRQTGSVQRAGRSGFGTVSETSWASGVLGRACRGDHPKGATLAIGAAVRVAPGEAAEEVLPGFPGSGIRGGRSG